MVAAFSHSSATPQLSPNAKVSLLTCGAGEELYSTFGHSAIRVCDTVLQIDNVYNYGTFDFSDPNFYSNFVRGKLNYMLSVGKFNNFMLEYMMDERWVFEQSLNLDSLQRQAMFDFLENNRLPENRYYLYDFLFDNCSTRIRDVFEKTFPNQVVYPNTYLEGKPTFRDLLYRYLEKMPWSKFGIDLLLTHSIDREATPYEYMFLPDFLMSECQGATLNGEPLVSSTRYLFESDEAAAVDNGSFVTPVIVFWALFVAVLLLSLVNVPLKIFDTLFFFVLGLLGMLFLFMWFGTDHRLTNANLNLLWALPSHAVLAFWLLRKQRPMWLRKYFLVCCILSVLLFVFWKALPQRLNTAVLPILGTIALRTFAAARTSMKSLRTVKRNPHRKY